MDTQEIINKLEKKLYENKGGYYICFLCLEEDSKEYEKVCHQYLTALALEEGGLYDGEDFCTITYCFPITAWDKDMEQERRKMVQWLIGYFLTWQPL